LGEDVRPEVARKLMDERGEKEPLDVPSPAATAAPAAEPVQPQNATLRSSASLRSTSDREAQHGQL